jgi:hypothetical protein
MPLLQVMDSHFNSPAERLSLSSARRVGHAAGMFLNTESPVGDSKMKAGFKERPKCRDLIRALKSGAAHRSVALAVRLTVRKG